MSGDGLWNDIVRIARTSSGFGERDDLERLFASEASFVAAGLDLREVEKIVVERGGAAGSRRLPVDQPRVPGTYGRRGRGPIEPGFWVAERGYKLPN
ncbi:MAG: hypothetical protein J7513_01240 [Solirubrobacteraceae bacterium]|nr:hypothetical protein [Solirubrobacteraceae bacterium]